MALYIQAHTHVTHDPRMLVNDRVPWHTWFHRIVWKQLDLVQQNSLLNITIIS